MLRSPRSQLRVVLSLVATLTIGAFLLLWYRPTLPRFATPASCLETYRDAARDGDAARFHTCLAEPLQADAAPLFAQAQRDLQPVRHWNQYAPEIDGDRATILVDQVRTDGMIHRIHYRLERFRSGWRVVAIGQAEFIRPPVRPGTHVNDTEK